MEYNTLHWTLMSRYVGDIVIAYAYMRAVVYTAGWRCLLICRNRSCTWQSGDMRIPSDVWPERVCDSEVITVIPRLDDY